MIGRGRGRGGRGGFGRGVPIPAASEEKKEEENNVSDYSEEAVSEDEVPAQESSIGADASAPKPSSGAAVDARPNLAATKKKAGWESSGDEDEEDDAPVSEMAGLKTNGLA